MNRYRVFFENGESVEVIALSYDISAAWDRIEFYRDRPQASFNRVAFFALSKIAGIKEEVMDDNETG